MHMYIYIHACMHVCTYACMHICIKPIPQTRLA